MREGLDSSTSTMLGLPWGVLLGVLLWVACIRVRAIHERTAMVVVLGDVGRSPRMCYHIASLVRHGWTVYVAGHFDTQLPRYLCTPQVHRVPLWSPPSFFSKLPRAIFVLVAAVKVPMQTLSLWLALVARTPKPAVVLVQTPPAIPTLMVVQCACLLTRSRLFLDWHNLAYTLLALRLGPHSPLVRVSETLERLFGRHADAHLFVTQAMLRHLAKRWHLHGAMAVLHDRPPAHFHRLSEADAKAFFDRVGPMLCAGDRGGAALAVTSTSWTPDENMHLLLEAASMYEERACTMPLRSLVIVITGKGPLREIFERTIRLRTQAWKHVRISTAWLSADDYPRLLGAADVGISLHSSSSGLDLPMKVVDMLGCGLRVCALSFACLDELIQPGVNGDVFSDAQGLASCLERLANAPSDALHTPFLGAEPRSWDALWDQVVVPLLPSNT